MDRNPISEPVAQFHLKNTVYLTEFSPYECSANLLAVGFQKSILIVQVKLPEEDDSVQVTFLLQQLSPLKAKL